jgi:hypothetical protein
VSPSVFGFGPSPAAPNTNTLAAATATASGGSSGANTPRKAPGLGSSSAGGAISSQRQEQAVDSPSRAHPRSSFDSWGGGSTATATATATASQSTPMRLSRFRSSAGGGASRGRSSSGGSSNGGSGAAGDGEAVHQIDSTTLLFDDQETARSAAAAIMYAHSVDADATRWVACGLPTCFSIELACAVFEGGASGGAAAGGGAAAAGPWGLSAAAAAAPGAALGPGPWGGAVNLPAGWCEVLTHAADAPPPSPPRALSQTSFSLSPRQAPGAPRRASLTISRSASALGHAADVVSRSATAGGFVGAAAAASPRAAAAAAAPRGPNSLAVYFSTPLGLAVAHVRAQHLVALQRDGRLDTVLAVPLATANGGCATAGNSSGGGAAAAEFEPCFHHKITATIACKEGAALASSSSSGGAAGGGPITSGAVAALFSGAAGSSSLSLDCEDGSGGGGNSSDGGGSGGGGVVGAVEVEHSQRVYAVLHVMLTRREGVPPAAGDHRPGSAAAADGWAAHQAVEIGHQQQQVPQQSAKAGLKQQQQLTQAEPPASWAKLGSQFLLAFALVLAALLLQATLLSAGASGVFISSEEDGGGDYIYHIESWVARVVAAVQPGPELLNAAALAAAVAALLVAFTATGRRSAARTANSGGSVAASLAPSHLVTPPVHLPSIATASRPPADQWSLTIVGASLVNQPDAYVQAQIKQLKSAAAATAAATAAASLPAGVDGKERAVGGADLVAEGGGAGAAGALLLAATAAEGGLVKRGLPMLISEPEPSWLTPDIHQR